jgi:uncharacterized protein (TIGR00725 family)
VPVHVAVLGPGEAGPDACVQAREVGRLLAERGAVVFTGGLGGVMAAAAQGAADAGGMAVGLLPGTDRNAGNGSTVLIPTGLGELRNAMLIRCADSAIAVGGSWGTLSEIALAGRAGKPVVCLGGWSVHDGDGVPLRLVTADSAAEAVRLALAQPRVSPPSEQGKMDG